MVAAFHKPYGVISQFSDDGSGNATLAGFGFPAGVYPIGRLDADSEGLLLLSDEKEWTDRLLNPRNAHPREYWAQVERIPDEASLDRLRGGVVIGGRKSLPCGAWLLEPQPEIAPREPPIRFRKNVSTAWIGLELVEGKNRQVRRMTAAVGHPTLRLIRQRIGGFWLAGIEAGKWRELNGSERTKLFKI